MIELPSFKSIAFERLYVKNEYHWYAAVPCDQERPRDNPGLTGQIVLVDDQKYLCKGVERHMPAFPVHDGETIGLLLEGPIR